MPRPRQTTAEGGRACAHARCRGLVRLLPSRGLDPHGEEAGAIVVSSGLPATTRAGVASAIATRHPNAIPRDHVTGSTGPRYVRHRPGVRRTRHTRGETSSRLAALPARWTVIGVSTLATAGTSRLQHDGHVCRQAEYLRCLEACPSPTQPDWLASSPTIPGLLSRVSPRRVARSPMSRRGAWRWWPATREARSGSRRGHGHTRGWSHADY